MKYKANKNNNRKYGNKNIDKIELWMCECFRRLCTNYRENRKNYECAKCFEKLWTDGQSWDVRLYIVQVEYSLRGKAVLMPFSDDVSVSECKNRNNVFVLKAKIDLN